ncbi:MAG: UTRA domain-containing protein [Streptosporangiales bacterium]|nr:UTRA domain-containing protein [Streptosporangiales bacterium]
MRQHRGPRQLGVLQVSRHQPLPHGFPQILRGQRPHQAAPVSVSPLIPIRRMWSVTRPTGAVKPNHWYLRHMSKAELSPHVQKEVDVARNEGSLYRRVADDLRRKIETGQLQPGNELPSERMLIGSYKASRNTVRKALDLLINEGLVSSHQGKGYFVRQDNTLPYYGRRLETKLMGSSEIYQVWEADLRELGREPRGDLNVSSTEPPADIARMLRLDEGQGVIARKRTRLVDDQPYAFDATYYPYALVENSRLLGAVDIPGDPDEVLAELGHKLKRYDDEVRARMPNPEEERALRVPPGTPVTELARIGYDQADTPVRVHLAVLPGDRLRLVYEHGRE